MARVRREIASIESNPADQTLHWYAVGVAAMRGRPIADPGSWRYQSAIHEYVRQRDPLAQQGEALPSAPDIDHFWDQCQHNSWFFLPWHRMYLHHFEQMLLKEIVAKDGPEGWALPYWNYSRGQASRKLPQAFRNEHLPNGDDNPLWIARRAVGVNSGADFADSVDTDLSALKVPQFTIDSPVAGSGFGGPATAFNHGGGELGEVDRVPHGAMHMAVGGWMGAFNTAALDPIFWVHHANIDRLWEVWLRRNTGHQNPDDAAWLSAIQFKFQSANGIVVPMACADVLDTTVAPLDYEYDDVSDPLVGAGLADTRTAPSNIGGTVSKRKLELVAASREGLVLGTTPVRTVLATTTAHRVTASGAAGLAAPARVFLQVENLTSDNPAPAYDVYLGVPAGANPADFREQFVGRVTTFGLVEASRSDARRSGSGFSVRLEITDVLSRLREGATWDPDAMPVSFVPVKPAQSAAVRVGRISLRAE